MPCEVPGREGGQQSGAVHAELASVAHEICTRPVTPGTNGHRACAPGTNFKGPQTANLLVFVLSAFIFWRDLSTFRVWLMPLVLVCELVFELTGVASSDLLAEQDQTTGPSLHKAKFFRFPEKNTCSNVCVCVCGGGGGACLCHLEVVVGVGDEALDRGVGHLA